MGPWQLFFLCSWLAWAPALGSASAQELSAADFSSLTGMLGSRDAALVAAPDGRVLAAHHPERERIPASTLKLLTALAAFHYLKPDFRFTTAFYLGASASLKIKGRGDPLLISEVVEEISHAVAAQLERSGSRPDSLVLDNTFFQAPITIPGVSQTSEPYDAPNGALCVNFNTVNFTREQGAFVSAEPQTPLLPLVLPKIRATGMEKGRVTLSHQQDEITRYAGHLFKYFLEAAGVDIPGRIDIGRVLPQDRLVLAHESRFTLDQVAARMLTFSNNFMANQLFIRVGAEVYGAPATLEKGIRATTAYASSVLGLKGVTLTEGSGISRLNQISAREMMAVLTAFEPHRALMKNNGGHYFKTGHLMGVRTQVGFYERPGRGCYRYVIFLNTPGKAMPPVERRLLAILEAGN